MTFTTQGPGGRWLYTVAGWQNDDVLALTTDPSGATIALLVDSSYATPPNLPNIVLRKLGPNGYLLWERAFQGSLSPMVGNGLGADASGNIYLLWAGYCDIAGCRNNGTIDFGGGPVSLGTLVKLTSTGDFLWQRPAPLGGAHDLAVNTSGESALVTFDAYDMEVVKTRADGTTAWIRARGSHTDFKLTIDPSGNVAVGSYVFPSDAFFGTGFDGYGVAVAKLAASNGATLWAERIPSVMGFADSLGTSALGTIVVAGHDYFAGFFAVLEPNGEVRFVRNLPDLDWLGVLLAVDPAGKVSVVGNWMDEPFGAHASMVFWYNLAGDYLGHLDFPASNASGELAARAIAIASDHSTVFGGVDLDVTSGLAFGTTGSIATGGPGSHAFVVGGLFRINSPSFIDEFDRWALGPDWDVTHGTFIDDHSAARGTSFGSYAFWTGVPGPNDTAEVTVSAPRNLGAIVRGDFSDPDRNHYVGYVDASGYIRIARRRDWVYSYLAMGRQFPSGSHTLSITATGSAPVRLTVQLDGTTVLTYSDYSSAAITGGGRVGMFDYNGLSQPIDRFRVIRR